MKRKTVCIFVNGILTRPGESENWTGRAVTWTHLHGRELRAEKVEYYVGPISRAFGQKKRAQKLRRTLQFYQDWNIVLVGHSNGCDVILDALKEMDWPRISELHFIAAACEASFEKNGLNASGRQIGRIAVYMGTHDWALTLAVSHLGRLVGYGALGKTGPKEVKHGAVEVIREPYGHSDWFSLENLNKTMFALTARAAAAAEA